MKLQAIKRTDWRNYVDPKDQERARQERWYRLSRALWACVEGSGRVKLVVEGNVPVVSLSSQAEKKLLAVLQGRRGNGPAKIGIR